MNKSPAPESGEITLDALSPHLPSDPVIVEAGSKLGTDTLKMSRFWTQGMIHTFEPVPALFEKTKKAVGKLQNVRCYPYALSKENGLSTMHISSGRSIGSSSLLPPKEHLTEHPDTFFAETLSVVTKTVDSWALEEKIDRVDFFWLDTQGTELDILKNAQKTLKSTRAVYTEVSLKEMYEKSPLYPEVRLWMEAQGFRVAWEGLPWPDMGNVLFVRGNA